MTYLLCKSEEQIIFPKTQRARKQKASACLLIYLEHGRRWGERHHRKVNVHMSVLRNMQGDQDEYKSLCEKNKLNGSLNLE